MREILFIFILLTSCYSLSAHPGIGIVKDSKGNIYYTDLERVWKIGTDGKRTIAVPDVHTHELYMDPSDNLYGEHSWYNGERLNTWGHYVWCLKNNGALVKIKEPASGFLENYSFVRDGSGNMYWAEHWKVSKIKKKSPDGRLTTLAEGKFKDIRWMHATASGKLFFIDLTDLYEINEQGKIRIVVRNLHGSDKITDTTALKHYIFGIWLDKAKNIYLAVTGERVVKRITGDGVVSTVVQSSGGWSPTSGLFDDAGNLWLMETNVENQIRVRKIAFEKTPPKNKIR
jgi:hypothetical protein